jgi:hypothetical protein
MERSAYTELDVQKLLEARPYLSQLRSRSPGLRERIGNRIYDLALALGLRQSAQGMREGGEFAADFVPGVGAAVGGEEAGSELGRGNYLSGGLGLAMSMIPGGKALGRAGNVIDRTNTGWTFKDVKAPHKLMEPGDWRKVTQATNTGEGIMEVDVPIRSLNATQGHVNPDFAESLKARGDGKDLPFVIKKNGEFFVQDGHHRLTAQAHNGAQTAKVRLVDLDGTTQTDFPLVDRMQAKKGIKGFHGSPHDFDRFDSSKIGTGEGAQAYGHGLYIAESEGVAKSYRDNLAPVDVNHRADGEPISHDMQRMIGEAWQTVSGRSMGPTKITDAIDLVDDALMRQRADAMQARDMDWFNKVEDMRLEARRIRENPPTAKGKMYEVNINADPDDFLDWDKPLSEQSEKVRGGVRAGMDERYGQGFFDEYAQQGHDFRDVRSNFDDLGDAEVSNMLREKGIPGIKYLDGGSRKAGDGSRNYVVFDDRLIDIVRKWGIPAAISTGLITQEMADQMQQQGEI